MSIRFRRGILALLALGASGGAIAQQLDVKPGLWEVTIEAAGPAQRICYTADVLRSVVAEPPMPPGVQCRNQIVQSNRSLVVMRTSCSGNVSIDGETRMEVANAESMSLHSSMTMNVGANRQSIRTSAKYRWLASDCGNVKPFDPKNPLR